MVIHESFKSVADRTELKKPPFDLDKEGAGPVDSLSVSEAVRFARDVCGGFD